ncbi:hypothetical protein OAN24_05180 [Pseudodesulfovibrio sp.]|nr:hypothetical protein [Pseudodesulfovibrio sp.]
MTVFYPFWLLITDLFLCGFAFYHHESTAKEMAMDSIKRPDLSYEKRLELAEPFVEKYRRKVFLLILFVFAIRVYCVFGMNTELHEYNYEVEELRERVAVLTIEVDDLKSDLEFSSLLGD